MVIEIKGVNMLRKSILVVLAFFSIASFSIAQDNSAKKFAGVWKGVLDMQGQAITVIFTFTEKDGKLSGTAESPEQGGGAVEVEAITISGNKIQFEISAVRAGFEGTLKEEKKMIDGTLIIQEMGLPLALTKDEKAAVDQKKPDSVWEGTLSVPTMSLKLIIKVFKNADGSLTGTMDSPDQKATNIPLTSISLTEDELKFEAANLTIKYTGKIDKAAMTAKGTFAQGGQEFPLDFKKAAN